MQLPIFHNCKGCFSASLLVILLQIALAHSLSAQYVQDSTTALDRKNESDNNKPLSISDKLIPGGNFGIGLGTQWYVDLSPSLGYQVNERFVPGAGVIFNAYGGTYLGKKYLYQLYGANVFARYRLLNSIYANGELEWLNVPYETYSESKRVWTFNPLIGASYIMPFGQRGGIQVSLLYNLNFQPNLSPYPSPFVWRVGFFL